MSVFAWKGSLWLCGVDHEWYSRAGGDAGAGGLQHCSTADWKWEKCFALVYILEAVSVRLGDELHVGQKENKRGKY